MQDGVTSEVGGCDQVISAQPMVWSPGVITMQN